jgi:hypothetical protein
VRWHSRLITNLREDVVSNSLSILNFKIWFRWHACPIKVKEIQTPKSVLSIRTCPKLASRQQEVIFCLVGIGATKLKRSRIFRHLWQRPQLKEETSRAAKLILLRIFCALLGKRHPLFQLISMETLSMTSLEFPARWFKLSKTPKIILNSPAGKSVAVPRVH